MTQLHWLPALPDWKQRLKALPADPAAAWEAGRPCQPRLNFVQTNALDEAVRRVVPTPPTGRPPNRCGSRCSARPRCPICKPAIRVAGLRRGIWIDTYENEYGQYPQELSDQGLGPARIQAQRILLTLDAYHLTAGVHAALDKADADAGWTDQGPDPRALAAGARRVPLPDHPADRAAGASFGAGQQRAAPARLARPLPRAAERPPCGRWPMKTASICWRSMRTPPATASTAWHDAALWHRAKQEIAPPPAPLYGDLVGRLLAAKQGRSYKCLVLDLDNTMWGGVIGDDGMEGIVLGQGSALGEAFVAFQDYARRTVAARRDPRRLLEERRGERRGAVREAPRDGAAARRHRLLRRQLVGQGRQHPRHRRGAEHRPR